MIAGEERHPAKRFALSMRTLFDDPSLRLSRPGSRDFADGANPAALLLVFEALAPLLRCTTETPPPARFGLDVSSARNLLKFSTDRNAGGRLSS